MMMNLDYLAGLFDAEGSIGLYPGKRRTELRFCVCVANAERIVLDQIMESFGGAVRPVKSNSRKMKYKSQRPAWAWRAEYRACMNFARSIVDRVKVKKGEVELLISAQSLIGRNGKKVNEENLKQRAAAIAESASMKRKSFPVSGDLSEEYLAGFFDGDGTLSVNVTKLGYAHMTASIYNTNRSLLETVRGRYGGSVKVDEHPSPEGRPCYQLEFCGDGANLFLNAVGPHLILKAEQARLAIEFHRGKSLMKISGVPIRGKVAEFATFYKDRISFLNKGMSKAIAP